MDTSVDKAQIMERIQELARISKELEANAKMQANAANIVAVEQLKKKVTELTELQNKKMCELVALHPDQEAQRRYAELSRRVDEIYDQLKGTKDKDQETLRRLDSEIEPATSEFVHHFQTMVAQMMGAPSPDKPVFG